MATLSKSDYLKYKECPSYFWLWKNNRDVVPVEDSLDAQQRAEQGDVIEGYARTLFPEGKLVKGFGATAVENTQALVEAQTPVIFQATAMTDEGLLAMADILQQDAENNGWILYEVKSKANKDNRDEHEIDLAFQKYVFEQAGYTITDTKIIHPDKSYISTQPFVPADYLTTTDVTKEVSQLSETVATDAPQALRLMNSPEEPTTCECLYNTASNHCPTFSYFHKNIPDYSIYDLTRVNKNKIRELLDLGVLGVRDIPDDVELSKHQQPRVLAAKKGQRLVDTDPLQEWLSNLEYPLYFLDYETVQEAIPTYPGYAPYTQIPFQYSLHVQNEPGGSIEHYEYLATELNTDPIPGLLEELTSQIQGPGSVIVWYKPFEKTRNTEMGKRYPEYADQMARINEQVVDLMDVVSMEMVVDPAFKGSSSIKKVLPVLAPDLSYKDLDINNGGLAQAQWAHAMKADTPEDERQKIFADLLEYCELDTWAMVRILQAVQALVPEKENNND